MKKSDLMKLSTGALLVSACVLKAGPGEAASLRVIPIPKEEHGYSNFETMVIYSQDELDAFLERGSQAQQMGWNNRADFEKALAQAKLDFHREALVLLRHTEGSGSVRVTFRPPRVQDKSLLCQIDREEPEVGTADMAFYCFALAVVKADLAEVKIQVSGRQAVVVPLKKENLSKETPAAAR